MMNECNKDAFRHKKTPFDERTSLVNKLKASHQLRSVYPTRK